MWVGDNYIMKSRDEPTNEPTNQQKKLLDEVGSQPKKRWLHKYLASGICKTNTRATVNTKSPLTLPPSFRAPIWSLAYGPQTAKGGTTVQIPK